MGFLDFQLLVHNNFEYNYKEEMKMKKMLIGVLVVSVVLCASSAFAAWANYYVKATGPYASASFPAVGQIMMVKLSPAAGGTGTYFRIDQVAQKEILAVALTAMSTGSPVRANIEQTHSNSHWSDYSVKTLFMGNSIDDLN